MPSLTQKKHYQQTIACHNGRKVSALWSPTTQPRMPAMVY
ncbi:hypothetical protein AM1_C0269 (plasmid) [Acaryochloris marina MBIC11017]|uniref:Uncharacterized protein n=1 Tax=Acaryochloris marina (strain MBIC 11017) TaxID=329726 RepID=A8ZN00_ACAM1|nr:hypothetical protein AM1_C0269 [Acaryochloris marina MBIC11017]